jgi:hypothetical protein
VSVATIFENDGKYGTYGYVGASQKVNREPERPKLFGVLEWSKVVRKFWFPSVALVG